MINTVENLRTAHFFNAYNDLTYLSSKCVLLKKSKLVTLYEKISNKINELTEQQTRKETQIKEYTDEYLQQKDFIDKQLLITLNNYCRLVSQEQKTIYCPSIDYEKINKNQDKEYKNIIKKFISLNTETKNHLLNPLDKTVRELKKIYLVLTSEIQVLTAYKNNLFNILEVFNNNNESHFLFENRIIHFLKEMSKSETFKSYFFDYYIYYKSFELQYTKKEMNKIAHKMVNKYKYIMKLRKQKIHISKYLYLIKLLEDDKHLLQTIRKEYQNMAKETKQEILKYKCGYFDKKTKEYKIIPSHKNEYNKEIENFNTLFYGDDYADISEYEEILAYASYYIYVSDKDFKKENHFHDKIFNAYLLIRLLKEERNNYWKEESDKIEKQRQEEEEAAAEAEAEDYTEEKNRIKNIIHNEINNICQQYEIDIPVFFLKYREENDDEVIIFMEIERVNHIVHFNLQYEDRYYLSEFLKNEIIDEFLEDVKIAYFYN